MDKKMAALNENELESVGGGFLLAAALGTALVACLGGAGAFIAHLTNKAKETTKERVFY